MAHSEHKKQIFILHGGDSFSSYDKYIEELKAQTLEYDRLKPQKKWKPWIAEQLPETDVLLPTLPNGFNAVYDEWTIYFEKLVPFFGNNVQLVGHSLGAMFLAKYLHQKPLMKKVRRIILIAGAYDDETTGDNGSFLVEDATGLDKSADEIHLFHSEDDPVVPFAELAKFQADLPRAVSHVFDDRGHFNDETFPELLKLLKQK